MDQIKPSVERRGTQVTTRQAAGGGLIDGTPSPSHPTLQLTCTQVTREELERRAAELVSFANSCPDATAAVLERYKTESQDLSLAQKAELFQLYIEKRRGS